MVKPYTSDTVSVIANFAKLSYPEQGLLLGKCRALTAAGTRILRC